jgi:hypothetical protein
VYAGKPEDSERRYGYRLKSVILCFRLWENAIRACRPRSNLCTCSMNNGLARRAASTVAQPGNNIGADYRRWTGVANVEHVCRLV